MGVQDAGFDDWASRFGETVTALELVPEGTGYRARTRFARFFNLPELMAMFREVADIKTADQLNLPTPEVEYHVIASKPTENQRAMVKELSKRAEKVHSGTVDAHIDNMLKITSDGRKLGLDQRIINPLLPDEPGTKVNRCVENVLKLWREGQDKKLTQLVFSDISTPNGGGFNIYDDIRRKLIVGGMPRSQIMFIHEADSDKQKKDLFRKVNSGQVRVLLGSTQKMGAGTNVQQIPVLQVPIQIPAQPGEITEQQNGVFGRHLFPDGLGPCKYLPADQRLMGIAYHDPILRFGKDLLMSDIGMFTLHHIADLRHYVPTLSRRSRCFPQKLENLQAVLAVFVRAYDRFGLHKFRYRSIHPDRSAPFPVFDFL